MSQYRPTEPALPASRYWAPFTVALVLLLVVDPLTTLWAVTQYGPGGEMNPLMRWLIQQGPIAFGLANLAALVVSLYCFSHVVEAIGASAEPYDRYLSFGVQFWLALLIAGGLFVCANNLSVVLRGYSLL